MVFLIQNYLKNQDKQIVSSWFNGNRQSSRKISTPYSPFLKFMEYMSELIKEKQHRERPILAFQKSKIQSSYNLVHFLNNNLNKNRILRFKTQRKTFKPNSISGIIEIDLQCRKLKKIVSANVIWRILPRKKKIY